MRYAALDEAYAERDIPSQPTPSPRSSTPSSIRRAKESDTQTANDGPSWRRIGRFSGLIVTTIASATLLSLYLDNWKAHSSLPKWISEHQATTQLFIQAIAGLLGMIQTSAICELINTIVRNRLRVRPMRLNTLHFWISVAQDRMDWDVQWRLLAPLAAFCLLTVAPAALWAGAMAPVFSDMQLDSHAAVPSWKSFPSADKISPELYTLGDQKRTSNGLFSYSVGINQYGRLAAAASSATSPDGKQPTRQKPDGTQTARPTPATSQRTTHYFETGYYPRVSCIYNESAAYELQPKDENQTSGYSWWRAVGVVPNSNWQVPQPQRVVKRQHENQTIASTLPGGDDTVSSTLSTTASAVKVSPTANGNTTIATTLPNQDSSSSSTEITSASSTTIPEVSSDTSLTSTASTDLNSDTSVTGSETMQPSSDTSLVGAMSPTSTDTPISFAVDTPQSMTDARVIDEISRVTSAASSTFTSDGDTSGSQTFFTLQTTDDAGLAHTLVVSDSSNVTLSATLVTAADGVVSFLPVATASDSDEAEQDSQPSEGGATQSSPGASDSSLSSAVNAQPTSGHQYLQEADPYVGIYGSDYLVSFGTPSTPPLTTDRYLAFAAGKNYEFLNQAQCEIDFEPTVFRVSVGVYNRTISVQPMSDRVASDINPAGDLQFIAMRQFTAVAHQSSGLDMNLFGESLRTNVGNHMAAKGLQSQAGSNYTRSDDNLPGITAIIEAMVDDILLGFGGAQAVVGDSAEKAPAIYSVPAVGFGQAGYIIAIFIFNALVVTLIATQAIMTRFWSQLPAFDCLDPISIVLASSKGGSGLGHLSDSADVGEMRVSLLQTEKKTEPLTCWQPLD